MFPEVRVENRRKGTGLPYVLPMPAIQFADYASPNETTEKG